MKKPSQTMSLQEAVTGCIRNFQEKKIYIFLLNCEDKFIKIEFMYDIYMLVNHLMKSHLKYLTMFI